MAISLLEHHPILQTWTKRPQKRQDASAFALAYILRLRFCRLMGAFIISPLPPMLLEESRTAGSLRSTGVAPLPRYYTPHRHPLVFSRLPSGCRLYGLPCSADFATGRGGFLQLRDASLSPCCHFHPAGVTDRVCQITIRHAAFALPL